MFVNIHILFILVMYVSFSETLISLGSFSGGVSSLVRFGRVSEREGAGFGGGCSSALSRSLEACRTTHSYEFKNYFLFTSLPAGRMSRGGARQSPKIDRHARGKGGGSLVDAFLCPSWGGRESFGGRRRLAGQVGGGPEESLDTQGRSKIVVKNSE